MPVAVAVNDVAWCLVDSTPKYPDSAQREIVSLADGCADIPFALKLTAGPVLCSMDDGGLQDTSFVL